ncbi:hypothetical protein [Epibacterium ulvae]|uniref:hypothetical protein n=1 Tax=Epibacterium ulvae TaxID=1156985 RepID=UPI00249347D4|nr:hypothetical protein [Epibacterium ulvae]
MTTTVRISQSDMIASEGLAIRPLEPQNGGWLFERVLQPGIVEWFSHEDLMVLLKRPDTKFHPNYFDLASQKVRSDSNVATLNELPVETRTIAIFRKAVCDVLLQLITAAEFTRTHAGYERIKDKLGELVRKLLGEGEYSPGSQKPGATITMRKLPGSRRALEWLRAYENAGYSPLALIPKTYRSGNRQPRWCPKAEALMNQVIDIYANTQRPTKVQAVADTKALFASENQRREKAGLTPLMIPSAATIRRRLNLADPYYVYAKRHGTAAANKKFTLFENGSDVVMPLERVEMDENKLDAITLLTLAGIWDHLPPERRKKLESGRRWIYIAIDCATKCVLSLRLAKNPNSDDAIRALRDIFRDKTPIAKAVDCESTWHHHGSVQTLVTDMGSAFVSDDFQGTVSSLGITAHLPPAGTPWLRGHIESFFRTLGHRLMPLLLGRTFFDTVERGDYPSEQLACLCDDDLITMLLTYIVDIYHNEPHGSLNGETPNQAWERLTGEHGVLPVPDGLTMRKAFGRPLERKLRGDGVLFAGLSYSCDALREAYLHSPTRDVEIRADLSDIGWIAVKVGKDWHPAIANQSGFDGVSYEQLIEAMRSLRLHNKRNAEQDAPVVRRAIERISEAHQRAFTLRELTPFHVTTEDVERHEAALHYAMRSDADRLDQTPSSDDPLASGIEIKPSAETQSLPEQQSPNSSDTGVPVRRKRWTFNNGQ